MAYYLKYVSSNNMAAQSNGQGGVSNQPGGAQKSTLFLYKNVVDYNILDNFSA